MSVLSTCTWTLLEKVGKPGGGDLHRVGAGKQLTLLVAALFFGRGVIFRAAIDVLDRHVGAHDCGARRIGDRARYVAEDGLSAGARITEEQCCQNGKDVDRG